MGNALRSCLPGRGVKPSSRPIVPNHMVDENISIHTKAHPNHGYASNRVRTTRYTVLTFLPKNLFEQFHRFANIYFIFLVALNWIPQVQAFAKEVAVLPVLFVLLVTALKDAFEDFRRYRADKKINGMTCRVFSVSERRYVKKEFADIHPGDFVHLSCNETIPADILFIRSSDEQGICHIETSNIDGESNLKQRQVVEEFAKISQDKDFIPTMFTYTVEVEQPNSEIYSFKGSFIKGDETVPLNNSNFLLRGCCIRNTDFIEGLVIYAGAETKAMLNNKGPRHKISRLEAKINRDVIWCVILLLFLCFFCAIGSGIWLSEYNNLKENTNLVPFIAFGDLDLYSPLYQGFIVFWTYIIIFQSVIPLPLYVSLELVKLFQVYFIVQDIEMYCEESDKPMEVRALNITEDLGQVEYVFSDKTGTLTENRMEFKACTVGGLNYPHIPSDNDLESRSDYDSRQSFTGASSRNSSTYENLHLEPALQRELSNMCTRSLDSVELMIPAHVKRVQEFFFLMAVCNTVVVSYIHEDNMDESGYIMDSHLPKSATTPSKETIDKSSMIGRMQSGTPQSLKSRSLLSLSVSESGGDFISEGSVTGSSFLSEGSMRMHYEAESPDELALVKAASTYGCKLKRRSPGKVKVFLPAENDEVEYEVLNTLHFDATRKRMSVIVRHPDSGNITLYCKGADSCIFSILDKKYYSDEEEIRVLRMTQEHLDSYAMKGLRTLGMGKRSLSQAEYKEWVVQHKKAENDMNNRDELVYESCLKIEKDLELLGATGIEDKLQEGVPSTISHLRQAGMKVWVLTGDKQETAIQIAYACHLFSRDQEMLIINAESMEETKQKLDEILVQLRNEMAQDQNESVSSSRISFHSARSTVSLRTVPGDRQRKYALVINGPTLNYACSNELERRFLKICLHCQSVVCCRATPIQKATVVKLVRDNLKKLTLAIGDGANDVSMIQTADIGIGISGQEGMQAVMSSDFAIARFRFLERLLFVHGHWNHDRLAKFAAIMFFKSLVSVMVLFFFQLFSGFSGSLMIDSWPLMMHHVIFTAAPPLAIGVFDKDLSAETLLSFPSLYKPVQRGEMYTHWTFLIVLIDATYLSMVCYFVPHLAYSDRAIGLWEFGTVIDINMVLATLLFYCIETSSWVWIQWGTIMLSLLLFWSFILISNAIFYTFDHPANPYWVTQTAISSPTCALVVIMSCFIALLPRLIWRCLQITIFPNEIGIAKRHEKQQEMAQLKLMEEEQKHEEAGDRNGGFSPNGVYGSQNGGYASTGSTQFSTRTPKITGQYFKHHDPRLRQQGEINAGYEGEVGLKSSTHEEKTNSFSNSHYPFPPPPPTELSTAEIPNVGVVRQRSRKGSGSEESVIS